MTKFNRVDNVHCAPWLVIPTVYQDALSYEEQLNKFCYSLNQIIGNVNQLPDYIKDLISEYINSGEINDIIRETLSQYILNVKYPPKGIKGAVGDGTADDTEAIQGCIDYANKNGGMAVYFPSGKYLTDSLTVKNNVSLFGFDRYTTKVVLKGGATKALINSIDGSFSVSGMTLDGNAGNQVNDVNVLNLICRDVLLADLILEDGFKLLMWNGTGGYLQIDNIVCGNAVNKCFEISGNSKVTMNAVEFTQLSSVGGQYVIEVDSNHGYYEFSSVAVSDTCLMCTGNDNTFRFREEFAKSPFIDGGERNIFDVLGVADYNKLTGSRSVSIGGNDTLNVDGDSNTRVSKNRTMHIEGANTFAVDGNSTESVDGNKSSVVTGVSSDTYNGDRTVNGVNQIENFTGKKVINAVDIALNPNNPLTYRKPKKLNDEFNYIDMKDNNETGYKVLCDSDNLPTNAYSTPEKYGAKGDGLTDDTEAFKSMLLSEKNILLGKNKTYIINNLMINNSCIINMNGATLKANRVNSCLVVREKAYIFNGNIITDIVFNDNGNAVKFESNSNGSVIENVDISGFIVGVYCASVNNITIKNIHSKNHVYLTQIEQGGYNVLLEKCREILISGCHFEGGENARHCIYLSDGNENISITNNILELLNFINDKEPVIYIRENNNIRITGNVLKGGTYSVFVSGTKSSCKNVIISNNNFSDIIPKNSDVGKYVMITLSEDGSTKPSNVCVTSNTISNTNSTPIAFFVIGDNISITGNSVIGNYSNIFELSNCKCFITGNNVINATVTDKEIKVHSGVSGEINGYHGKFNNVDDGALYMDLNFNNEIDILINEGNITAKQIIDYAAVSFEGDLLQVQLNNLIINREYITFSIVPYNSTEKFEITCNRLGGGLFRFTIYKNGLKVNANTFVGNITVRV